jgi:N-acetylmuramoyl-L-alanine amidase
MSSAQGKTRILGNSTATPEQMRKFLWSKNQDAPDYSQLYLDIGAKYGVRGDLAFSQSIKETGAWKFGGSVSREQNNFSGLGAVSSTVPGASFATPAEGIEAQIQHLYGYATKADLPEGTVVVDPRFDILKKAGLRGTAPHWEDLNGKWAVPGTNYGQDIVNMWMLMTSIPTPASPGQWKKDALQWLKDQQLIVNEHDPDSPVTWAEFGVVLRKLHDKLKDRG